jgi:lyso-ornithine lipid O-acyltransferase
MTSRRADLVGWAKAAETVEIRHAANPAFANVPQSRRRGRLCPPYKANQTVRALLSILAIVVLTLALLPFQWMAVWMKWPMRRRIPTLYHRLVCRILDVRIRTIGRRADAQPLLIVANHTSWLDISVITAVAPVVFVAKREVASWPVFGLLARLQRSIFVDRARRQKTRNVNGEIARRLAGGDAVLLFAEGTSSDGNRVLAFRTALIGSARDAIAEAGHFERVWIQPLSIAYTSMLGLPLGRQRRSAVAWYGLTSLLPHLRQLVAYGAIDVTVTWGDPVPYDESSDRKIVARRLEDAVRAMTVAALRGRPPCSRTTHAFPGTHWAGSPSNQDRTAHAGAGSGARLREVTEGVHAGLPAGLTSQPWPRPAEGARP